MGNQRIEATVEATVALSPAHQAELAQAKRLLEHPGYVARITDMIGMPVENALKSLPKAVTERISAITTASLTKCMQVANASLGASAGAAQPRLHSAVAAFTGAAGGAFGIAGLALELPVSTVVMLRSIADIGRAHGEDLRSGEAQLACLMVFSLGGKPGSDDASESGYYAARIALAKAMSEASRFLATKGLGKGTAPAVVKLIAQIAARFNVQVTQKAAATLVPVVGAAGGAIVNTLFINHFQEMARGHFIVRRLERVYGAEAVSAAYRALPA